MVFQRSAYHPQILTCKSIGGEGGDTFVAINFSMRDFNCTRRTVRSQISCITCGMRAVDVRLWQVGKEIVLVTLSCANCLLEI